REVQRRAVLGVVVEVVPEPDVADADPPLVPSAAVDLEPEAIAVRARRMDAAPKHVLARTVERERVARARRARLAVVVAVGRRRDRSLARRGRIADNREAVGQLAVLGLHI